MVDLKINADKSDELLSKDVQDEMKALGLDVETEEIKSEEKSDDKISDDSKESKEEVKLEDKNKRETSKIKSEDKGEESEEDDENQFRSKHIPIGKYRDQKTKWKGKIADKEAEIADLKAQLTEKESAKVDELAEKSKKAVNVEEKAEVTDDIDVFIKENNLDPKITKGLIALAEKRVLTPEQKDALGKVNKIDQDRQAEDKQKAEIAHFNDEWLEYEVEIKSQFPNATPQQIKEAKAKMDELAHSEKFHNYDLDYIYFKNEESFKSLLHSPKKRGMESGDNSFVDIDAESEDIDLNNLNSASDINKADKLLRTAESGGTGLKIMREGKEIIL